VKSFACEVVTPTLLDIVATTTSSAPDLYFATFGIFRQLTDSLPFGFALQFWFSCSFTEPKQGSCCLYAVRCVPNSQVFGTLGLSRSLPFRFYRSKCYFRHLNDRSLRFNSPALTIRILVLQLTGYALTLSLNTIA